jgi:amino acid transporter
MKISTDDQRAIGLILCCVGVLFFLIGVAAQLKASYHSRAEISSTGFVIAIVLAALGVVFFLVSLKKKRE